ncbi:MAG: helicase-related protein, partial [Candidatus Omnitrophica bacterium]|nr:helicase-related protein [Candidatus Omnitrophota bacterium]
ALIHGRMKTEEKERVMTDFCDGKYDILVATTVIEVGLDIPNVTVILIEDADHYGISQLHQLRGRIGRGKYPSYCILIGDPKTEDAVDRLSAITGTNDGFEIAEKDLDIRGPGELLGTRQSGLPELRFGNIARDFAIMEEARKEAFDLVAKDPYLFDEHNIAIKRMILERYKGKLDIL